MRPNASAAGFLPSPAAAWGWDAAGGNGCSREPAGGGCSHAPAIVDAEPTACPGGDAGGGEVGCVQSYTLELMRCSADEADHATRRMRALSCTGGNHAGSAP